MSPEIADPDSKGARAMLMGGVLALCFGASAKADCIAKLKPRDPVYEVVSCGPAEPIVEKLRQSKPDWYGEFTYAESDVVITVRAANDATRKRMGDGTEYWYYSSGCTSIREGMRISSPQLAELCCDVVPLSNLPCGVGGIQLLTHKVDRT